MTRALSLLTLYTRALGECLTSTGIDAKLTTPCPSPTAAPLVSEDDSHDAKGTHV